MCALKSPMSHLLSSIPLHECFSAPKRGGPAPCSAAYGKYGKKYHAFDECAVYKTKYSITIR